MIWFFASINIFLFRFFPHRLGGEIVFLSLTIMSAFRYYVGSDYYNYVTLYQSVGNDYPVPVEYSFVIFAKLLNELGLNFQSIIAFYSLLTMSFFYFSFKKISGKNSAALYFYALLMYMVMYFPSLSIIRQSLSSAIGFWGCVFFLFRGRYFSFLIVIFFSSLIHSSGVLFFLCYIFYFLKINKFFSVFSILFCAALGFFYFKDLVLNLSSFIGFSYKNHLNHEYYSKVSLVFIINTLVLLTFYFFVLFYGFKKECRIRNFLINIVLFILLVRLLAFEMVVLSRVSSLFTAFVPFFSYVFIYDRLYKEGKVLFLVFLFFILLISDSFRMNKDNSYYQYSINFCLVGDPCPLSIVGDFKRVAD